MWNAVPEQIGFTVALSNAELHGLEIEIGIKRGTFKLDFIVCHQFDNELIRVRDQPAVI